MADETEVQVTWSQAPGEQPRADGYDIRRAQNGGWVVFRPEGDGKNYSNLVGAFSHSSDLMAFLGAALS